MSEALRTPAAAFARAFPVPKPVIGMIHLRGDDDALKLDIARAEIDQLTAGGVDAVLVEDYFGSPEVVEQVLAYIVAERPSVAFGVNILRDFERTFALAKRYGAGFVQLDAVAGHLPPAEDTAFAATLARLRAETPVCVLGGVRFKYQPVRSGRTVREDLALATGRCDAVVVTGPATGVETDLDKILEFRAALGPEFPLVVGAGVSTANLVPQLEHTDGAIVGSWFKRDHVAEEPLEPRHVVSFMELVHRIRGATGAGA